MISFRSKARYWLSRIISLICLPDAACGTGRSSSVWIRLICQKNSGSWSQKDSFAWS